MSPNGFPGPRYTTRVEDRAYSLLGLFYITMPTLYGEGDPAFRRLQEEIIRRIPDQSLFAGCPFSWTQFPKLDAAAAQWAREFGRLFSCKHYSGSNSTSLFASSPLAFLGVWNIDAVSHGEAIRRLRPYSAYLPASDYDFTPYGMRTQLPSMPLSDCFPADARISYPDNSQWYLLDLDLGCEHKDFPEHLLGRVCYIPPPTSEVEFLYCGYRTVPRARRISP